MALWWVTALARRTTADLQAVARRPDRTAAKRRPAAAPAAMTAPPANRSLSGTMVVPGRARARALRAVAVVGNQLAVVETTEAVAGNRLAVVGNRLAVVETTEATPEALAAIVATTGRMAAKLASIAAAAASCAVAVTAKEMASARAACARSMRSFIADAPTRAATTAC